MRIVVVGAGYAGIACLARLSSAAPDSERHLVSPQPWHLQRTRLHEVVRRPLKDIREPLPGLASRWNFTNHHARTAINEDSLKRLCRERMLRVGRQRLAFDYLVLATGLPGPGRAGRSPRALGLDEVAGGVGRNRLRRLAEETGEPLWIVGAGASGLQFAFELAAAGARNLGLVDGATQLLPGESDALRGYVASKLEAAGIELRLGTFFEGFAGGRMNVRRRRGRGSGALPGRGVLLCTGPARGRLAADETGRLLLEGTPAERVFAAGDCASWQGEGFDAATAQAAIRKGGWAAGSVRRHIRGRAPQAYDARRLGFFLSLGPDDAVGWALSPGALLKGRPAVAAREAIEARWALLLQGVDTFAAF